MNDKGSMFDMGDINIVAKTSVIGINDLENVVGNVRDGGVLKLRQGLMGNERHKIQRSDLR
jgi:hypothetical protein